MSCGVFMYVRGNQLICGKCGCRDDVDTAIVRSVQEFSLLFPEIRITTKVIHDWCKVIHSKKTIRRVLMRNYENLGHGKSSHFVKL